MDLVGFPSQCQAHDAILRAISRHDMMSHPVRWWAKTNSSAVPPQSNIKDLLPFHATESNQWVACVKVRQVSVCVCLSLSLSLWSVET